MEIGLGKKIADLLEARGDKPINLPRETIKSGKFWIDQYLLKLPKEDRPDAIINNYGINHLSWIGYTDQSDEKIITTNILGPYWVVNFYAAFQKPLKVVNIASQTWRVPQTCTTLYCASKAGLVHMTRVMARELGRKGWQINVVCPGKIEWTNMSSLTDEQVVELRGWTDDEAEEYALSNIPMGRFTTKEEVATVVLQVLDFPPYVNGAIIDVTGGA